MSVRVKLGLHVAHIPLTSLQYRQFEVHLAHVLSPGLYWPTGEHPTIGTHLPFTTAWLDLSQAQDPMVGLSILNVLTHAVHLPVTSAQVVQFAAQSTQVFKSVLY